MLNMGSDSEKPVISGGFYKGLMTVAMIVLGVLYIENHITSTINYSLAPLVRRIEYLESNLNEIKPIVLLDDYKIGLYESSVKEFVKPDEPKLTTHK